MSVRYDAVLMAQSEPFEMKVSPAEAQPVELGAISFLETFEEENSTAERCFHAHSRSSVLQGLPFGGVPTVLFINVLLWMVHTQTHTKYKVYSRKSVNRFEQWPHFLVLDL